MTVSLVQQTDSGTVALASGASFSLTSAVGAGRYVALLVVTLNGVGVSSVTSGFAGTWAAVAGTKVVFGANRTSEWWVCSGVSGALKTITVSNAGAVTWLAWAGEIGGSSGFLSGGTASGTSASASITIPAGYQSGAFLAAHAHDGSSFSAGPGGAWNAYGLGWLTNANGNVLASQVAMGAGVVAPAWTLVSGAWDANAIVFQPVAIPLRARKVRVAPVRPRPRVRFAPLVRPLPPVPNRPAYRRIVAVVRSRSRPVLPAPTVVVVVLPPVPNRTYIRRMAALVRGRRSFPVPSQDSLPFRLHKVVVPLQRRAARTRPVPSQDQPVRVPARQRIGHMIRRGRQAVLVPVQAILPVPPTIPGNRRPALRQLADSHRGRRWVVPVAAAAVVVAKAKILWAFLMDEDEETTPIG